MTADSAPSQRDKLLAEGGLSYPKAMLALSLFRGMVQRACIDAMRRSLQDLSAALGLQMESRLVKPHANPDKPDPGEVDDTWAELGAMLKKPGDARWDLWNYIRWRDDPRLSVMVSVGIANTGVAERAWAAVRDHGTWKYEEETREIILPRRINAADLASLGSILDEMNREWSQGWQKVGGVKQFLRKR